MGYAVELYFDKDSTNYLNSLCEKIESNILKIGAEPHISLSVHDQLNFEKVDIIVRDYAMKISQFDLTISSIGQFPTSEGVLFVAPVPTIQLLSIHSLFHHILKDNGVAVNEYYKPGNWIPHCTMDFEPDFNSLAKKQKYLMDAFKSLALKVLSVGIVYFRPLITKSRYELSNP
ncbi:2'-5' RNA ligase family protein [Candidatus Riflebacteria bacterium]